MKKRDNLGVIAPKLASKHTSTIDHTAHEQMQEMLKDWDANMLACINDAKSKFPKDFFIVVETKKEPLMHNVLRNYFVARQSCPTPTYDNTVYRYHRNDEIVELLWVLPSQATCKMMRDRSLEIPAEERELLQYVLDDADGTLLQRSLVINKEIL